jgi:hypothetical protein
MIGLLYALLLAAIAALVACVWIAANPRANGTARIAYAMFSIPLFVFASVNMPLLTIVPGEWGASWFGAHAYTGMTRDQVDALRRSTLGTDDGTDQGVTSYRYTTGGSLCVVWGKRYKLTFDASDKLDAWKLDEWSESTCE